MTTVALITGANKGIGLETARMLGARGITVLLGCRDEGRGHAAEEELRRGGATAHAIALDVTDEPSIVAAAKRIEADHAQLDILVNNAGIVLADGRGLPSDTTLGTMRAVFETNVFGVVAVTNAMLPMLRRSPAGRIVNVSSEVGSITSMTDPDNPLWQLVSVPYPASKTALNMVTAMYAKELGGTGILVNAANPGYCATDFNQHRGFRTAAQGAEVSVHLATLPVGGPTGQFWGSMWVGGDAESNGVRPW